MDDDIGLNSLKNRVDHRGIAQISLMPRRAVDLPAWDTCGGYPRKGTADQTAGARDPYTYRMRQMALDLLEICYKRSRF